MNSNSSDEIDLIYLAKKLYKSRKLIIFITIIFSIIGVTFALLSPVKYSSDTIFITQNNELNSSPLSGVASLVGINLNSSNSGSEIPTTMYPQISKSPKFKRILLEEIIDKKNKLKFKDYIVDKYNLENNDSLNISKINVTKLEEACFKIIDDILSIDVNLKDGFITISALMHNAKYSAIIANKSKNILQKIIIENKIESARMNLIFSENQLMEKKLLFDEIHSKLANFSDSNINSINSFIINEKNKLQAEFEIINAVVTELSKQVEQAKLQVKRDTPVFSTIKEAVIPNERSSPNRRKIVLIFSFLGLFISTSYILLFKHFKDFYLEITN